MPHDIGDAGLDALVDWNPVYHVLQLVRAPLLEGRWPAPDDYLFALATACLVALLGWLVGQRSERRVIFYL